VKVNYFKLKKKHEDLISQKNEIILKKTATLIAACCAPGAKSVIEDENQVENMRSNGNSSEWHSRSKDDLFDYSEEAIGKQGSILKSKK
jgi:octaprenyl-diphosphate synthase